MATSNCTNCGCKKCGCQDDFLTTPLPCPTPLGCPDPEPCSEVINAECVVYTGLDIECDDDIVVETDTTLADALVDIVTYFCDNGGGGGTGPAGPAGATGATGPQGAQGVPGPVGPAGLNWQGSWSALGVYAPDDAVGYAGASWFCLNAVGPSPSNPTIDPTNWALLASEGAVGPQGPIGPAGAAGAAGATGPAGTTNIGKLLGGGIVVAEWDESGVRKALVASLTNLSSAIQWTLPAFQVTFIGLTAQNYSDGLGNTDAVILQTGAPAAITYASGLARLYNGGGNTDWYLPSNWELNMCYNSATIVNRILGSTGFANSNYWSSTEDTLNSAWAFTFESGVAFTTTKSLTIYVRAVRIHNI